MVVPIQGTNRGSVRVEDDLIITTTTIANAPTLNPNKEVTVEPSSALDAAVTDMQEVVPVVSELEGGPTPTKVPGNPESSRSPPTNTTLMQGPPRMSL